MQVSKQSKIIEEIREYFEQRADAEYYTDRAGPVPNEEMQMLAKLDELQAAQAPASVTCSCVGGWIEDTDGHVWPCPSGCEKKLTNVLACSYNGPCDYQTPASGEAVACAYCGGAEIEPVGWVHKKHLEHLEDGHPVRLYHADTPVVFDSKLWVYAAPPASAVPKGFVLVPEEIAKRIIVDAESWLACFGEPDKGDYYAAFVDLEELLSNIPPKQEN